MLFIMKNPLAEAVKQIHTDSMQLRDYYIVDDCIMVSRPNHPNSELELEDAEVQRAGVDYLLRSGVPHFLNWTEYEIRNGTNIIRQYRKYGFWSI